MNKHHDIIVIGAGQAGLAMSYYLTRHNIEHTILERGRIGENWRSKRWDSLSLVTPNCLLKLPGFPYEGNSPEGFMPSQEYITYLEKYSSAIQAPVWTSCPVETLHLTSAGGFCLVVNSGRLYCKQVVVATGGHQVPRIPVFSTKLNSSIFQISPIEYRNPHQLPDGAVLVVGSGQSGAQIAEELHKDSRQVYLSVGRTGRWPRRYRGKDIYVWMELMEHQTIDMLPDPKPRYDINAYLSGKDGGHEINLRALRRSGVVLLGRIIDINNNSILLADDLEDNLSLADEKYNNTKKSIDRLIHERRMKCPLEKAVVSSDLDENKQQISYRKLNIKAKEIKTVIWATGYAVDFRWIKIPVFDTDGYPIHYRGVTSQQGLYFLGLPWLYKSSSSGIIGVGEDAAYLAEHIHRTIQMYT